MRLLLLLPIFLFGFDFKQAYLNHDFKNLCKYGITHFKDIKKNENTLSLVGLSCVKSDDLFYLPVIINNLKFTKNGRKNSIYFSTLLLEKKLLIAYMIDNFDVSYYRLPFINHPISVVFQAIQNKNFTKQDGILTIKKGNKIYKVYKTEDDKVFIDEYENGDLIISHWYR